MTDSPFPEKSNCGKLWRKGYVAGQRDALAAFIIPNTVLQDDGLAERAKKLLAFDFGDESNYCIDVAVTLGAAMRALESKERQLRMAVEALERIETIPLEQNIASFAVSMMKTVAFEALSAIKGTGGLDGLSS